MLRLLSYFVLTLLVSSMVGCTAAPEGVTIPQDFSLRLMRGSCEGPCPIYSISVNSTGRVHWEGERFVHVRGNASKVVEAAAVQSLVRRARELRILALRPGKHLSCIDAPMAEIELTMDSRSIYVAYCEGDVRAEGRRVIEFSKVVDEALADHAWVGGAEDRRMQ